MMIKIPLQVEGVDLSSASLLEHMDPELDELDWVTQGPLTLAIVYSEESSARAAVVEAHDWALRIQKLQPGATVTRVFDELVGWTEIAARCGVTPEAVRTWAKKLRRGQGQPFPVPRQAVPFGAGKRSLQLYAWREVLPWIRQIIGLDPDEDINYLDDSNIAELDSYLAADRTAAQPGGYTPLPSRVLPDSAQVEAKLHAQLATGVQLLEATEQLSRWAPLEVGTLLLHFRSSAHASEIGEIGVEDGDLFGWVGIRSSLA